MPRKKREKRDTLPSPAPSLEGPELLKWLHDDWIARGALPPNQRQVKECKDLLRGIEKEMEDHLKAIEKLRYKRHRVAETIVKQIGMKQPINVDGVTYIVTSKGGLLYYRPAGALKEI